ncbi:Peptide chain release factor PrfB3, chloroplastic [Vitis vinifera]|uniref:Peptide chain release factor PrfB3, chloroplastic n=1 Tax=Vitis vinifera TaxID=29760 RepID=A0A438DKU6_VITVI|nr:Peptide chain release factor PrfB3, chloroplastic [Vitis vinifera]
MAKMAAESVTVSVQRAPFSSKWQASRRDKLHTQVRASQSMDDKNKVFKELGLFSLRKKIEGVVLQADMLAPAALELEEASRIRQEEMIRKYNLWDDVTKSNEILGKLADSSKVVDTLKDLTYKAEEAKLITQLVEMDAINHGLFEQAYNASVDIWAEQLLSMYTKWAEKQGYKGRVVEKYASKNGGIKSATIEFESEYGYGYLSGERGVHHMIRSSDDESILHEQTGSAVVDVIPLFLETAPDLQIDDGDLRISSPSCHGVEQGRTGHAVCIQHIPTGISVQSSGERSHFANKMRALNRLKAKLVVTAMEQGIPEVGGIKREAIADMWKQETRRYVFHPNKLVQDVKTDIQLPDLNSVLDGNIEPLIGANISMRQASDMIM